jgi:3-oxoacyl-[acyl-carrier-protein] synthase-1
MSATLAITAAGMVTPVGFNYSASCAAIRAGIRNVNPTNLWDKYSATYLAAGKVSLPQWWVGCGKLADLVAPAILECLRAAEPAPPERIPVLLGVAASDRPGRLADLDATILDEVEFRLGFPLHEASRVIAHDHCSIVVGLRAAAALLASGHVPCVIVAAVDSLLEHDLKDYYLEQRRLLTPLNSNGFCLGEAGSAVLVTSAATAGRDRLDILGASLGVERATIESDEPLRAEALTRVMREAMDLAGVTVQDVAYRIADLNGEHYKFKEMTIATSRFVRRPTGKLFDLWHPAEYLGDVGAAIGPLVLGLALHAGQKRYGNGPTAICTFGNDNGERAAVVVNYVSTEQPS